MMLVNACESNACIIMLGVSINWCELTDTQVSYVSKLMLYDASMIGTCTIGARHINLICKTQVYSHKSDRREYKLVRVN